MPSAERWRTMQKRRPVRWVQFEVEKVSDINEIVKFGVMITPALAVDGVVKAVGKVPSIDDIKAMLR